MGHKPPPPPQEEEGESAPLWIISFADMISLLMAFFVMLSTFSSFGPSAAIKVRTAVKAVLSANYGGWNEAPSGSALGPQAVAAGQLEKASERPTLDEGQGKGLMQETQTEAEDFRTRRVFVRESAKVFLGTRAALSSEGRSFLDTLASFMSQVQGRIVISESGPGSDGDQGLVRALGAMQYLASQGISKDRCSIAVKGMMPDQVVGSERHLEVVLLDEGAYR